MIHQLRLLKLVESCNKETKTIPRTFNEKKAICKTQNGYILTCILINYYSIIESCEYLLLSDKISSKKKIFITI